GRASVRPVPPAASPLVANGCGAATGAGRGAARRPEPRLVGARRRAGPVSPPLVPVGRVLRLGATAAVASRSLLAATFAWLAVLAAVYAADAGPPRQAMAFTAALLFPVAAGAAAAQLAAGS